MSYHNLLNPNRLKLYSQQYFSDFANILKIQTTEINSSAIVGGVVDLTSVQTVENKRLLNTKIGDDKLILESGANFILHNETLDNTYIGPRAGNSANLNHSLCVSIGEESAENLNFGGQNISLGYRSLRSETDGDLNVSIGTLSMQNGTLNRRNVCVGNNSMQNLASNNNDNVSIGYNSFNFLNSANCTKNILIGSNSEIGAINQSNYLKLGDEAPKTDNNTIHIGSTTPYTKFFSQGISNVNPAGANKRVMFCDDSGQVGSTNSSDIAINPSFQFKTRADQPTDIFSMSYKPASGECLLFTGSQAGPTVTKMCFGFFDGNDISNTYIEKFSVACNETAPSTLSLDGKIIITAPGELQLHNATNNWKIRAETGDLCFLYNDTEVFDVSNAGIVDVFGTELKVNQILEHTLNNGVTVDGVSLKDGDCLVQPDKLFKTRGNFPNLDIFSVGYSAGGNESLLLSTSDSPIITDVSGGFYGSDDRTNPFTNKFSFVYSNALNCLLRMDGLDTLNNVQLTTNNIITRSGQPLLINPSGTQRVNIGTSQGLTISQSGILKSTSYECSIQGNTATSYIEILSSGSATNEGVFFGCEDIGGGLSSLALYAYGGGDIDFYVGNGVVSTANLKFTMQRNGQFRIHDIGGVTGGTLRADPNGVLSALAPTTGWTTPTGTFTSTGFDTTTVTLQVLAEHVAALINDFKARGNLAA